MVEGSPRRVSVSSHDVNIRIPPVLGEEEEKSSLRFRQHDNPKDDTGVAAPAEQPDHTPPHPGESKWRKLRTTVQIGNAVVAHHRSKPPLKREDSFLKRFSTRPPNVVLPSDRDPVRRAGCLHRLGRASVLNPDESFLFWWLWLVTFCGLYNSWTLIAREAFPELHDGHAALWSALDWCSDLVYLLDVGVQFRTGYLEQGIMVRDGRQLARHYVRSRDFFLDVAALVPLKGVVGSSPLLRFPRFLKARRIYKFYYAVESRTAYPNLWRVANLIHVLLLLAHWFGCFYYMLSELEGFEGSWAYRNPDTGPEQSALVRKYLGSVYWSTLTLTTIGDLATPATNLQYMFTIISYLIGVFIFATIVGQVGNVITNRNASRLEFERLLDGAKLYMRHHKVPKGMQRRVQRWYDYSWSRGRMQGGGDIHSALGILPDKLKTELAIHVNLKTLKKVSIFKECQPEFLHDLVLKMKAYIFTPGDLVCRKGEVAREMFIIADGILQVINENGQVLTHMRAGDFFGEIGILNLDGFNRRTADVRSVGYSELFSLSREDVLSAMKDYPEAEDILQTMGRRRLLEARLKNVTEKGPFHEDSEGKNENRQRKKGINFSYLLRKKESQNDPEAPQNKKVSGASNNSNKTTDPQLPRCQPDSPKVRPQQNNSLFHFNQVRLKPSSDPSKGALSGGDPPLSPAVHCLVDQISARFRRRNKVPHFRIRRKHSWWYKISSIVHVKRKPAAVRTSPPAAAARRNREEECEDAKSTRSSRSGDPLLTADEPRCPIVRRSAPTAAAAAEPCERKTSWQASKPSVSNWNRSEIFGADPAGSRQVRSRRKTLSDGMLRTSDLAAMRAAFAPKKVPGILMTGSDLNNDTDTPDDDVSPMSSSYSLTPSTTDNGDEEEVAVAKEEVAVVKCQPTPAVSKSVQAPELPEEVRQAIWKIVSGVKDKVDELIHQSEQKTVSEILQMRERIREKDALIDVLLRRCAELEIDVNAEEPAQQVPAADQVDPPPRQEATPSSPPNRPSEESAVGSLDEPSQAEFKFEEEDLWLVEFPTPQLPAKPRSKLRRHSSVEVGRELPFRSSTPGRYLLPTAPGEPPVSPRRFSESQARPEVVTLNKSFAAKVRRVLAKVRVNNRDDTSPSSPNAPSPQSRQLQLLPTPGCRTRRSSTGSSTTERTSFSILFQQKTAAGLEESGNARRSGSGLPTITESNSFDSLRESPLLPHVGSSMPNLDSEEITMTSVVIDMTSSHQRREQPPED